MVDAQVTTSLRTLHDMLGRRARDSGMPEPEKPQAVKVAAEELLRLYIGTLSKPNDDPFRLRWLEGLARLRSETGCPALRGYLDTFMPAALRVERI